MTLASKITLIRVAFIPVFMVLMYLSGGQSNLWMWISLAVFIIASLTDYVDGHIARKYNQVSDFGKFLDPLADKLLTIAAMVMFCEWGSFPAWALMIVLTREFAVSGLRMVAGPTHTNLIFDLVVPFKHKGRETEFKARIDERVQFEDKKYYTVITFESPYASMP